MRGTGSNAKNKQNPSNTIAAINPTGRTWSVELTTDAASPNLHHRKQRKILFRTMSRDEYIYIFACC